MLLLLILLLLCSPFFLLFLAYSPVSFVSRTDQNLSYEVSVAFLAKFQLSAEELLSIKSAEVNAQFFAVLKRAQQIQSDAKVLLRLSHRSLTDEISVSLNELIDFSFKKLYNWVREEAQQSLGRELPESTSLLVSAFDALQDRVVLMNSCLEEIGLLRNRALVKAFIDALTRGGPTGVPKPIEIHAADPRRYTGDMCAWLHQTLASEHEFGGVVLQKLRRTSMEETARARDAIELLLADSFKDVCRPFSARVSQVLSSTQISAVTAFFLSNTFSFYSTRFSTLSGARNPLVVMLDQCRTDATATFQSLLSMICEKARQVSSSSTQQELTPNRELSELLHILKEISTICENSLVPGERREAEFGPLLDSATRKLVEVTKSNAVASKLTKLEEAVYCANCLEPCASSFASLSAYAASSLKLLREIQVSNLDIIVKEQVAAILRTCGMASKLALLFHWQNRHAAPTASASSPSSQEKLSSVPGMEAPAIQAVFRAFESLLLDLGTFSLPLLSKLESSELRAKARGEVARMVAETYAELYSAIVDASSGYQHTDTMARYKPDEIAAMFAAS